MKRARWILAVPLLGGVVLCGCGPARSIWWGRAENRGACTGSVGAFRVETAVLHRENSEYRSSNDEGEIARIQLAYAFYQDAQVDLDLVGTFPGHLTQKPGKVAVVPMWDDPNDPDARIDSGWAIEKPSGSPEPVTGTFEITGIALSKLRGKVSLDFEDGSHAKCTFVVERSD